jgi:hypothetical protein
VSKKLKLQSKIRKKKMKIAKLPKERKEDEPLDDDKLMEKIDKNAVYSSVD